MIKYYLLQKRFCLETYFLCVFKLLHFHFFTFENTSNCLFKACICHFLSIFLFFHLMIALQILWKCFLLHWKSSIHSQDIQMFVFFSRFFNTCQIQKDKWKWNNFYVMNWLAKIWRCNFGITQKTFPLHHQTWSNT